MVALDSASKLMICEGLQLQLKMRDTWSGLDTCSKHKDPSSGDLAVQCHMLSCKSVSQIFRISAGAK